MGCVAECVGAQRLALGRDSEGVGEDRPARPRGGRVGVVERNDLGGRRCRAARTFARRRVELQSFTSGHGLLGRGMGTMAPPGGGGDWLVYELYGLSDEEIAIVEEATK